MKPHVVARVNQGVVRVGQGIGTQHGGRGTPQRGPKHTVYLRGGSQCRVVVARLGGPANLIGPGGVDPIPTSEPQHTSPSFPFPPPPSTHPSLPLPPLSPPPNTPVLGVRIEEHGVRGAERGDHPRQQAGAHLGAWQRRSTEHTNQHKHAKSRKTPGRGPHIAGAHC